MISQTARDRLLEKLHAALVEGTFVKLTLSEPVNNTGGPGVAGVGEPDLRNVYARPVDLKEGQRIQFVYHYRQRDVTKNLRAEAVTQTIADMIGTEFGQAYVFTNTGDWHWHGPGAGRLKAKRPTFTAPVSAEHDRARTKAIDAAPWLTALGITGADGSARAGMADKLRQIERFTELLGHLVEGGPLAEAEELCIADLGAGKGYLTFAIHTFFQRRGAEVNTVGVELRPELASGANKAAQQAKLNGLEFHAGDIASYEPQGQLDVLVALHACNTATDDALYLGIRQGAQLIVVAPCCHQEVRPQIAAPPVLAPALRHGILLERHAELLTDAIRALLLEIHGYEARVIEFISPEHTGKNLMITAQRREKPVDSEAKRLQLRELLAFHGVREQRLARLLDEL